MLNFARLFRILATFLPGKPEAMTNEDSMPLLQDSLHAAMQPPPDWIDPDDVPRAVVTVGINAKITGRFELEPHRHAKAQFILCLRGVLTCEAEGGFWLVPAHSAVWIPAGMLHAITAEGTLEGYAAFIDPAAMGERPARCCTFAATPLLRELLIRAAGFPALYPEGGIASRIVGLLLEEMADAPLNDFHLPVPADPRLRKLIGMMMQDPADRGTIATWAKRAGLSERTLSRLIASEAGMSFGRWRQQLGLMLALQKLAKGSSIQQVAADLGYESASSFVTMFRKALGVPPGRYMNRRQGKPAQ